MAKEVNMLHKGSGLPNRKRIRHRLVGRSERSSTGRPPGRWVKMVDGTLMGTYMKGRFVEVVGPAYTKRNQWGWGPPSTRPRARVGRNLKEKVGGQYLN